MVTVADTAFSIAVVRAEESGRPPSERLFEDPYAALFPAIGEDVREATERYLALPFFRDGIRLRTRYIDDAVKAGLAAGLRQLVLLGAGFDARALRLAEVAATSTRAFEIDFPAQLARKRAALEAAGVAIPEAVALVGFDFAVLDVERDLGPALEQHGFRTGEGAIFVWEGVIGYIDDAAINASLRFIAKAGGPTSRLIFTSHDEAFAPDSAIARVRKHGFSTCEDISFEDVWRRYLPGDPHPTAWVTRIGTAVV